MKEGGVSLIYVFTLVYGNVCENKCYNAALIFRRLFLF